MTRRITSGLLLVTAVMVAACNAGTATDPPAPPSFETTAPGATGGGTSPTDGPPPAGGAWPWDAEPPEDHPHVEIGVEVDPAATPGGESLGEVTAEESAPIAPATDGPGGGTSVDPCTLITAGEWGAWTEAALGAAAGLAPIVLEEGEACGWIGPGDRVRMAIAALATSGAGRWLDPADAASGTPVAGLGDGAVWLASWPLASSSTLVVQAGPYDLVIEMSSLDPADALLLEGAQGFAVIALGRLP